MNIRKSSKKSVTHPIVNIKKNLTNTNAAIIYQILNTDYKWWKAKKKFYKI